MTRVASPRQDILLSLKGRIPQQYYTMHEIGGQQQDKDGYKKIVMICCHLKQTSKIVTHRKIKWEAGHQDIRGELMWSLGCFVCGHAYVCMC